MILSDQKKIHSALENLTIGNYKEAHKILTEMVNENFKKSIGDWVVLWPNELYQIKSDPNIFKENRLATSLEVEEYLNKTKL